jgi:Domain of unknown function (DUF4261)
MGALVAELLFDTPPTLDADQLLVDVRRSLPETTLIADDPSRPMLAHQRFTRDFIDARGIPILTAFIRPDDGRGTVLDAARDLDQTWNWPDAADVIGRCPTSIAVAEMMGTTHEPRDRVQAFCTTLLAAVDQTSPRAIWWPHSTKAVRPAELRDNHLAGIINVRLFRIEDDPGVVVMDTLGLHVLGLPDLQCHFRSLDMNAMAGVLYDAAVYLLEHGDVIADGNTIGGVRGDEHWRCQHEAALVAPDRLVVDIDPGDPYAAGGRDR